MEMGGTVSVVLQGYCFITKAQHHPRRVMYESYCTDDEWRDVA